MPRRKKPAVKPAPDVAPAESEVDVETTEVETPPKAEKAEIFTKQLDKSHNDFYLDGMK